MGDERPDKSVDVPSAMGSIEYITAGTQPDKNVEIPEPEEWSTEVSIVGELDVNKGCHLCGSSLKRWFFKVIGCIHQNCPNYYQRREE